MAKITKTKFSKFLDNGIFAKGESVDNEDGLNATGTGREIHWIAIKGSDGKWAVYYAFSSGEIFIRNYGEKLRDLSSLPNVLEVDSVVLSLYRK
jgi:hypothetical protein